MKNESSQPEFDALKELRKQAEDEVQQEVEPTYWNPHEAGLALVCGWAFHAREPYACDLLLALMAEFQNVFFVVAFDGFFYDPKDAESYEEGQLCTLSLFAAARRARGSSYAQADLEHAKARAPGFIRAWVAGWRARCPGS